MNTKKEKVAKKMKNYFVPRKGQEKSWQKMQDQASVWGRQMSKEDYYKKWGK